MRTDVSDLSLPAVEREITTLAGHLAAATCRYLQLIAVFDTAGGWRSYGLRSCSQWLSWKCGLSPGTAREQLRVAHALEGLPRVREAFAAGRLSAEDGAVLLAALVAVRPDPVLDPPSEAATDTPGARDAKGTGRGRGVERPDAARDAAHSDAAAVVLLAQHALAVPPPEVGTTPIRLVVHTTTDALPAGRPASAEAPTVAVLDAGPGVPLLPLGPDTLRRLACEALVEPATHPDTDPSAADDAEPGQPTRAQHRTLTIDCPGTKAGRPRWRTWC